MPDEKVIDKISLEGAKLIFKNFSGNPSQFNPEGKRNFCVLLDPEQAASLKEDGWNVRWLEGRAEGEEAQAYMQVAVSYDTYPPNANLVTANKKLVHLNDETIKALDWAEISHVDLVIRPYSWEVNGKKGVKGYLKSMYVTMEEDAFANKYADLPSDSEPQMHSARNILMEEGA